MNNYYLPQLHKILVKKPRAGKLMVEVVDQPTQYDSSDNLQDWSGQWSEIEEEWVIFEWRMRMKWVIQNVGVDCYWREA